jgi:membrane carboxypeptidase/penicillin-binding protein
MTQWTPFVITNIFYNLWLWSLKLVTKAWVGGIDKYFYDHVGQGARQVGSTFKPFVYATAIEQLNMSPCDSIIDAPFTMPVGATTLLKHGPQELE